MANETTNDAAPASGARWCECCETRRATKTMSVWVGGKDLYREYLSCDECNPGSPDYLREMGFSAVAQERAAAQEAWL